jgi:DNA-binding transcriptional ArsR family regulator
LPGPFSCYNVRVSSPSTINSEIAEESPQGGRAGAPVMRVRLTPDDLVRTRIGVAPAPLAEAQAGFVQLRRGKVGTNRWAARARRNLPETARLLADLIAPNPPWPGFVEPIAPDLDEGLEIVLATPKAVLRAEVPQCWHGPGAPPLWLRALARGDREALDAVARGLGDLYRACIAPYWSQVVTTFRADVAERIPILAAGGLAGLLGTLHEDLTWRDGSLERKGAGTFSLEGQGLQLMPSAVWAGPPMFVSHHGGVGENAIIYQARRPTGTVDAGQARDLGGLLGHTRAAVLHALRSPRSTADLAAFVGISAPSASEHASVLRASGLVHTVRSGRAVRHSLSLLGRSLLDGNPTAR